MTTVLKLGGSVITDKASPETVDETALGRAADAVAGVEDLVLVHGGGSFGHHHASEHGFTTTEGRHDAPAARAVHEAMGRLNAAVLDALQERDVPALPVRPLSAASRDADGELALATGAVRAMLAEGLLPVTHGDVIAGGGGVTVVSGDELVVALAGDLAVDRVGLCSAAPGVLDAEGNVIEHVASFDAVSAAIDDAADTDVTGGMAGKVRRLLALDAPAQVFDLEGLAPFLAGERPGTTVD